MFLSLVKCISTEFFWISPNFSKFCKIRRIRLSPNFLFPTNFQTLCASLPPASVASLPALGFPRFRWYGVVSAPVPASESFPTAGPGSRLVFPLEFACKICDFWFISVLVHLLLPEAVFCSRSRFSASGSAPAASSKNPTHDLLGAPLSAVTARSGSVSSARVSTMMDSFGFRFHCSSKSCRHTSASSRLVIFLGFCRHLIWTRSLWSCSPLWLEICIPLLHLLLLGSVLFCLIWFCGCSAWPSWRISGMIFGIPFWFLFSNLVLRVNIFLIDMWF
jgi:hypothetical protein